jgi:hypothetical protein
MVPPFLNDAAHEQFLRCGEQRDARNLPLIATEAVGRRHGRWCGRHGAKAKELLSEALDRLRWILSDQSWHEMLLRLFRNYGDKIHIA